MGLIEACRKGVTFFSKRLQPPWLAGLPVAHLDAEQGEGRERGEALGRGWGSVPAVGFAGAWWCVRTCGVTAARAGLGWPWAAALPCHWSSSSTPMGSGLWDNVSLDALTQAAAAGVPSSQGNKHCTLPAVA